jgi:hypothetical protein
LEQSRAGSPNATEWLERFAAELGVDAPSKDELKALLALAAEAAHSSERIAAPVACWLAADQHRCFDVLEQCVQDGGIELGAPAALHRLRRLVQ